MAATITIDNLENGQGVNFPYEVTGQAVAGTGGAHIVAMAWQIDDQDLHDMSPNPSAGTVSFEFSISQSDCPDPDTWYLLTVYAWDNNPGDVTTECRTIRQAPQPVGGGGIDSGG